MKKWFLKSTKAIFEDSETNIIKTWTFIYAQQEECIFKLANTKWMFWLNTIAFFNIAFKVYRKFFDFMCKVWTNFCKIRIEMLGNEVYICNSFRLVYDVYRET